MKGELQMRAFLLVLAGAFVLAAPQAAAGGGWATVGLGPPDGGVGPGETWNAEMTILQHGVTPLEGVSPSVIISNGKTTRTFAAKPTGKPGVYLAEVTFPGGGEWNYKVNDGFSRTHSFAPVQIGGGGGDSGFAVPDWTWGLLAAAAALAVLFLVGRRMRPATAPVAR
jgi:hypothetical protein